MKASKQRGVFRPAQARRLRNVFWLLFVGVTATSFAGACGDSSSEKKKQAELAEGCVLNSDCKDPYSCTFQRCHEQCVATRDCPDGQRCVLTDEDFHVCQLDDETTCEKSSDCQGDQQCGQDAECRDECDSASDCVDDQVCANDGSCAENNEVDEDGNLPDELGSGGTGGNGGTGGDGGNGGTATSSGGSAGEGSGGDGGTTTTGGNGGTSTTGSTEPECGNEVLDEDEECDDGGTQPGDGCDADCNEESGWICDDSVEPTVCEDIDECDEGTAACHADATCHNEDGNYECECNEGFVGDGFDCEDECEADPESCSLPVVQMVTGYYHSCALFDNGKVRCWGYGAYGATGYGNTDQIGDNELPTKDVTVGGTVVQLAAGGNHTCALLDNGAVRCWGDGAYGALGYGNSDNIGDTENPGFAGNVDVGGDVQQIATGTYHTCALLDSGAVRCWGYGAYGALGYGNTASIGDDEVPDDAGNVELGGTATQIAVGNYRTCAVMTGGGLKCWGYGYYGALGYGNQDTIGDDETPADVDEIDVGGEVSQVALGDNHTCALLTTGTVRCWGLGDQGQLGYGNTNEVGDGETPDYAGDVPIGATATGISCGMNHTCVVLEEGGVLCWGQNTYGELGQGDVVQIGDDETPDSLDPIVLGDTAETVDIDYYHACVLTTSANVRCWGYGGYGSLGYGNTTNIGDDENPSVVGPVELL